jgi:dTDP-4-amino-4,6-dideoxygalactose transaminase
MAISNEVAVGNGLNYVTESTYCPSTVTSVPLFDIQRQMAPLRTEIDTAISGVFDSGQFVLGPEVKTLESKVADFCQSSFAVGCASGSDALLLALMAADIGVGDEVIVPSYTFFSTASAVTRVGAKVVFADIDPRTFNIDPTDVAKRITKQTKAIIPVHLFGQCADMNRLCDIAHGNDLLIVEDAAQAIGAEYQGRRAGSLGDMGCFSFYPTKNLGGPGDGGMLTSSDERWADRLSLLRVHGMRPRYYHQAIGVNSRLDSLQAAVLNVKLPHLEKWTEMRISNAVKYEQLLNAAGLADHLELPVENVVGRHVWNQYVIRVRAGHRDALRNHLNEAKVGTEIYYPVPLHRQACFSDLEYPNGSLPETEKAAIETLALPIFPELADEEQRYVVQKIASYFESVSKPN